MLWSECFVTKAQCMHGYLFMVLYDECNNARHRESTTQYYSCIKICVARNYIYIFVRMHDYCVAAYVPISTTTHRPNSLAPHCITYLQHFFAPDGRSATTTYYLSTYLLYCIASCVFALLAPGLLSLIDWREDGSGISRHLEKPEMSLDTTEKSTLCKGAEKVSLFHPNGREQ